MDTSLGKKVKTAALFTMMSFSFLAYKASAQSTEFKGGRNKVEFQTSNTIDSLRAKFERVTQNNALSEQEKIEELTKLESDLEKFFKALLAVRKRLHSDGIGVRAATDADQLNEDINIVPYYREFKYNRNQKRYEDQKEAEHRK